MSLQVKYRSEDQNKIPSTFNVTMDSRFFFTTSTSSFVVYCVYENFVWFSAYKKMWTINTIKFDEQNFFLHLNHNVHARSKKTLLKLCYSIHIVRCSPEKKIFFLIRTKSLLHSIEKCVSHTPEHSQQQHQVFQAHKIS